MAAKNPAPTVAAETPWTMSVPEAGRKYFNRGRYASYKNAGSPESGALIPCVDAGPFKRALPRLIEKRLAGD